MTLVSLSPAFVPLPPQILAWMRGFSATYLRIQDRLGEGQADLHDQAATALVNFNVRIMAPGSSRPAAESRFFGVDRVKIAKAVLAASESELADWERGLETIDARWKKGLCDHLALVADAIGRGGFGVFEETPGWIAEVRAHEGRFLPETREKTPELERHRTLFLERSFRGAVAKGDFEKAFRILGDIEGRATVEADEILRRAASDYLSDEVLHKEILISKRWGLSQVGQRALLALACRRDPVALKLVEELSAGDKVLFDYTLSGARNLGADHSLVLQAVARVVLTGQYGFEGLHVLESSLRRSSCVLPKDRVYGLRVRIWDPNAAFLALGEERKIPLEETVLRAVFQHRSGLLLLKLLAKNPSLDPFLRRPEFARAPLYFTPFHLHLLEPLARERRSRTLAWLLKHPGLLGPIRGAAYQVRGQVVTQLITVYHQAAWESDREAVASLMEETGHEDAVLFFRREILRLRHERSIGQRMRSLVGLPVPDPRAPLEARIQRMLERKRRGSA